MVERLPRVSAVDQLGLIEPDRCLGEGVVIAIADGPDRGVRACVDQPLSDRK